MKELQEHKEKIIKELQQFLQSLEVRNSGEKELLEAMRYSLISETAKYIRSFLILETVKMLNKKITKEAIKIAMAIEMIHCYSLIHDDLPSMDNSDFRRNQPSLHKKFSESTAILAGNSLLTLAFELLANISKPKIAIEIIKETSKAVGIFGIMSGQVLDLNPIFKQKEFEIMNYCKTGKLIELCMILPSILLQKSDKIKSNLATYGRALGKAYQMQDDLLDAEEETFSYIKKIGNVQLVEKEIETEISYCETAIANFKNNEILKLIPKILAKRKT